MDTLMLNQGVGQITSNLPFRIVFALVFVWWNLFQFVGIKYLKRRDGPPLPEDNNNVLLFSVRSNYRTFKEAKKYPNLFRYLLCWFLFSDGLNTMATSAVLFATSELGMTSAETAIILLEFTILGAAGCILFLWIQRKLGWNSKKMILLHLSTMMVLSLYTLLGIIPNSPIGVVSKMELYLFVVIYSLNLGSLHAFSRSTFASIVPVGKESEMFALYEVTNKGSSWIGPLVLAFISNVTSIRYGWTYSVFMFGTAIVVLWLGVVMERAIKEAGRSECIGIDEGKERERHTEGGAVSVGGD